MQSWLPIELMSRPGTKGEFRCLACNHLLEVLDGSHEVALRLTVQPKRKRMMGTTSFQTDVIAS
jgi:hypothetical protein